MNKGMVFVGSFHCYSLLPFCLSLQEKVEISPEVINSPSNPTGEMFNTSQFQQMEAYGTRQLPCSQRRGRPAPGSPARTPKRRPLGLRGCAVFRATKTGLDPTMWMDVRFESVDWWKIPWGFIDPDWCRISSIRNICGFPVSLYFPFPRWNLEEPAAPPNRESSESQSLGG